MAANHSSVHADPDFLGSVISAARTVHGLGKPETRNFQGHFARMRAVTAFGNCVGSSSSGRCRNLHSPFCGKSLCCACCADPDCIGCDFHRVAAEYFLMQLPGESDADYRRRVQDRLADAAANKVVLDYGLFSQKMLSRPNSLEGLAQPVNATAQAIAEAVSDTLSAGKLLPPRFCLAGEFKTSRVTSQVFLFSRMFVILRSQAATYRTVCRDPAAIQARSTFIRHNLCPVDSSSAALFDESLSDPAVGIVFDDDCLSQASLLGRDGRPTLLLHHVVTTTDHQLVKFATCSCNESGVLLTEELVSCATSRDAEGAFSVCILLRSVF